tara:strand:+ start:545 stop:859 length:315 start_codon:yes stop_codon:yes gene_type:complete
MVDRIWIDGVIRDMTAEEQAEADKLKAEWNSSSEKLKRIKRLRQEHLNETDWWVFRGEMTDEQKAWRKSLRDIPTTYSESDYDDLLNYNKDTKKYTHSIWTIPS